MTHKEKIGYMRIAAGIAGFSIKNEHLDLLVSLYEIVLEKKEKTTVEDAIIIEHEVEVRTKQKLLDEVSKKVSEKNGNS